MKMGRRQFVASTMVLAATGCSGGGTSSSTPAPTPAPSPSPSPSPSPTPTPTPTPSGLYPSYNVSPKSADSAGMTSTAVDISGRIKLGWNAGNTLEAVGVAGETSWGNPMITQAQIDKIKALGFDAVRLPCSWDQYSDKTTAKITDTWLNRVKDIVQYCMNANLYVLLNIHWDGGWLETHVDAASKDAVNAKQKAFWEQIATHLRDFDERLMFASANEPNADTQAKADICSAITRPLSTRCARPAARTPIARWSSRRRTRISTSRIQSGRKCRPIRWRTV